jgi:glycosyltransferase involved in cell wall biosynthesis
MSVAFEQRDGAATEDSGASQSIRGPFANTGRRASPKMRILNLAREFPFFPGGHGGNTRAFCLLRRLSEDTAVTVVTNIYAPQHVAAIDVLRNHTENLFYYRDPVIHAQGEDPPPATPRRRFALRPALLATTRFLRTVAAPLPTEARLWSQEGFENIRPALQQALRAGPYDVLQIEYTENADWGRHVPIAGPKILIVHDVKSVVWWRRFRNVRGARERLEALSEALRFYFFERSACRSFDALVAMSEDDRLHLQRLTGHPQVFVIPNGVDLDYFRPVPGAAAGNRVVFTATMNHPPNVDGILYFAREVWPRVLAEQPQSKLDIVGSNPPPQVVALADDSIRVTGFVPDTRPYIAAGSVFVCPLRFASGTRLKILEAMAMGKPVVSTRVGAEGIDCTHGKDVLLVDEAGPMADAVVDLLRHPAKAAALGEAARGVARAYAWEKLAGELDQVHRHVRAKYVARRRARQPRIALNGLFLVPGGITGGIGDYFHHLVRNLLKLDAESRYLLLANPGNALELTRLRAANLEKLVIRDPLIGPALGNLTRALVARALRVPGPPPRRPAPPHIDADLVHCIPGYIDDLAWNLPCLLTVADIQHEFHPEFFSHEELLARRALFRPSIEHARHVIAISEFTRQSLIERFEIPPEKISVVHLGVDPRFFATASARAVAAVRGRYALPDDYCLYPANLWPHKNHPRLLDALAAIPPQRRPHLVLTGSSTQTQTPLRDEIRQRSLDASVSWLGYVEADHLHALVAGARMMVFPSLFEGFGMPVVEAMAAGCPVACARATSLPEIVADAALLFDPTSADAIADAIERLWGDAARRTALRAAGREQARRFQWRTTALRTRQIYQQTLREILGTEPNGAS